jgi:PAS domain-containing protein
MELFARAVSGEQLRVEWHGRSKDGVPALAGSVRQARDHRRRGPDPGARAATSRSQASGRKRCERAKSSIRAMFNASIDGLALCSAAGEVVDTNPALWRMYGY